MVPGGAERGAADVLTEQERQSAEAEFEAELQAEHARRADAMRRRKAKRVDGRSRREEEERRIELYELREEVRRRFYKENGYKRYIDSTGREVWLTPEEFAARSKRRRRRKLASIDQALPSKYRTLALYGGLALLATVLGFALAR
jgi:hypothetical protein